MTIVRYAPSPTGRLHLGNARPALLNWLFAKARSGTYILRLDDTDSARSTAEFERGIKEDLGWLGIAPDATLRQSDRTALYDAARDKLIAAGRLYPAFETENELDRKRMRAQAAGQPPIYDRAALRLTELQKRQYKAEGRKPHWRFRLDGKRISWNDLIRGECEVDTASMSDPVLIREDGAFLYTLPSVVDDIDMGITHVIRGEDHVTNTGVQIEVFEALGANAPAFAHFSLLVGADGEALSKRLGSLSISELRAQGYEPLAITSHIAKLGTSDTLEPAPSLEALSETFDFAKMGRHPARYDPADLARLNAAVLHAMPYPQARLEALGADLGETFWNAVRANLTVFADVEEWAQVVRGPVTPIVEDAGFLAEAAALLADTLDWSAWAEAVKAKTGAKGRTLFRPLRLALTGKDHGPEMGPLLALIGREKALKRLGGQPA